MARIICYSIACSLQTVTSHWFLPKLDILLLNNIVAINVSDSYVLSLQSLLYALHLHVFIGCMLSYLLLCTYMEDTHSCMLKIVLYIYVMVNFQ